MSPSIQWNLFLEVKCTRTSKLIFTYFKVNNPVKFKSYTLELHSAFELYTIELRLILATARTNAYHPNLSPPFLKTFQ